MSGIDEVKVDKDRWQSEPLLESSRENDDGDSNDSDSTVVLANQLGKRRQAAREGKRSPTDDTLMRPPLGNMFPSCMGFSVFKDHTTTA